ncbi:MrcB family domain-containing protein [Lentzea sp. NPDC102401]|uniref:MrcB family domain-containing protein n=1 Tax=Lentzea sp. NPDC102401 TaxID=3364128 RepID=UPI0037F66DC5
MRELLRDVLLLQSEWTSKNTPAMEKRGRLIRHDVASWLRERLPAIERAAPVEIDDWDVEAKDATGAKSEIPWARVHSVGRSPSATRGWYVVYLFGAQGDRVYLSLMQGATRWENSGFPTRPRQELWQRAQWARDVLATRLHARADLVESIELKARRSNLGRAYEDGNVVAFEYSLEELPSDDVLADDLVFLVSALSELYELVEQAVDLPGETAPEIADAEVGAERLAGKARRGQGLRLDASERIAIERRAVAVATRYLVEQGYSVKDVGATKSYDLDARRAGERLYVEVKGTTTAWTASSEVILTRNEVDLHRREHPNTMLLIVSRIALDRSVAPPVASGGVLRVIHPWQVEEPNLTPMSYRYLVGE